jgi:hypothetical protein
MAYLEARPYQFICSDYPLSGPKNHPRHFQASWFTQFSSWLKYSPTTDAAYCLTCYLFTMKPVGRPGWDVFITKRFRNWKKVMERNVPFLTHIGEDPCSPHNNAVKSCEDLK